VSIGRDTYNVGILKWSCVDLELIEYRLVHKYTQGRLGVSPHKPLGWATPLGATKMEKKKKKKNY
jgi:hypothetical protein